MSKLITQCTECRLKILLTLILGKKHGFKITLRDYFYSSAISDRWIQVENNAKRLGDHLIEGPFTNLDML